MTESFVWRDAPAARFAVIGDPISHSLSPKMQSAALAAMGEEGEYVAIRVPPEDACLALEHLASVGYQGINVTVPNKGAVLPWLAEIEPFAERVRAVNTIDLRSRKGINTDGPGFLETLSGLDVTATARFLVLGAGGAARSIVAALTQPGSAYSVAVWNRTRARADALVQGLGMLATVQQELNPSDFDVVVNATSSTLADDQDLAIDWSRANGNCLAYDLSYPAEKSEFLRNAARAELRTTDGKELLVAQGARSLGFWVGREGRRDIMRGALG